MRKFAYFLIFIGILLIVVPLVLIKQGILEANNSEKKEIVESTYDYISYNDLTDNNKVNILSKLYSKSGTQESTKLKIDKQTYTIYEIMSPEEIYKIEINKEKKLLTSNIDKFKDIDFYVINTNNTIVKLNFSYDKIQMPTYKDDDTIKKDDWIFYYDKAELTMFGYYPLENGNFKIKIGDGHLSNNMNLQNSLIDLVVNNIKISKEATNEIYTNSYNNSVTSYLELSKDDTIYQIDKNNIIDFNNNFYITKWSISDNWLSNEIDLVSKDYSNTFSIRESIKEYSLDTIKRVLKGNNIEEIEYKDEKINIIHETITDRTQGYIKKINNRSYTILYNLNKSTILNNTNNDNTQFVEFTENILYQKKKDDIINNGG